MICGWCSVFEDINVDQVIVWGIVCWDCECWEGHCCGPILGVYEMSRSASECFRRNERV